eukprot:3076967-Prymnesium_polylepis.1
MTSGDMMLFARHSIDLLLPLIGDTADPLWQCWVAHVRYVRLLMQTELSYADVVELDKLVYQHHDLFLNLCESEYGERLFKPKNHFATHFATDILNFGPVRAYWCMRFEALNQLFKNIAKSGTFKNTCKRCADFWCIRMARERDAGCKSHWGATRIELGSAPKTYYRMHAKSTDPPAVGTLLSNLPRATSITIESWAAALYHQGGIFKPAES